ncbi:ABC transporter permease subunit [Mesorhizobium sp.]|jgi:peptide/nickel transport system permease protein|uniref:ABC transporter permease n=1 Tax=Mesorhizobium sp. TaxID=1871066 RepID=UPI000FE7A880|nr:ABC transporter permease subunit [Mesorhizobium sp.]RWK43091.1 MAG: ABC transporter permease subunit [Mesorhizobium sp.]RWK67994.1 MAG: ABC transporter permease subunit [Mesorhizobium sp.]RWK73863.1 MAG: ABC transporter permease subunit [Mesorhizobium sp.]RWK81112.1 MAG: ABC transporter permease subunit [Mesorhizobium sp.]RWL08434.1 MAG: ABC transporter permease subunit [Mesorhizobium sp.]
MKFIQDVFETIKGMPKLAVWAVGIFLFLGIFAPWLTPYDPNAQNLLLAHEGPSIDHWLGTDHVGRDTASRLIASARTSVVGMSLVLILALSVGVTIGTIAGYRRGWVEEGLMRIVDVGLAMPSLIVALAVIGIFGTGYWNMILALALAWWPGSARISRAVAVNVMNRPHIESLRVLGASPWRIYFHHLLPATLGAVLVYATADAGAVALAIATLSFLGLGIQPPTPEWGQMLVDALPYLEASPRQVILPGLALTLVVIGFNLLGESIALNRVPTALPRRLLAQRRKVASAWKRAFS